ncbi:rod shape-determining protein MreD [uncultured Sphingomonas sp.]|uniref:rod shape-determining protein MreD n=1 Tax=uncultured Sphingomonas sp. TaxID=158754 RepID=UPI0025D36341|nr:rod shape-determining protein MreD [uncultured Sphingomonas sp.]
MAVYSEELTKRPSPLRLWLVPIAATLAGSAMALLPFVANTALLPPFGLLMALGWRLLRPEMWPAWMALPLGLADDLMSGAPLGSAAALWTIIFLAIDLADTRPMWRDFWLDWMIAGAALLFGIVGAAAIDRFTANGGPVLPAFSQILLAILLFPPVARLCARLDRWRLRR